MSRKRNAVDRNVGNEPKAEHGSKPAGAKGTEQPLNDVPLGNIVQRIKALLQSADEDAQQRDLKEMSARRKRIDAARLMATVVKNGSMTKEELYEQVLGGVNRKNGMAYFKLAELYDGFDEQELERREAARNLMSLNQAEALGKELAKLKDDDEKKRLTSKVRDGDANVPRDLIESFSPKDIETLAGGMDEETLSLRERLGIEQARIDELRAKAPVPPQYAAEFKDDEIVINALGLLLVFAALTESPESIAQAIEFFSTGGSFVIRRKGA